MTSPWRTDVQGLRAVAVCLVIAGHAGLAWAPGGFIGVDVFFVLSGFLITSLLLREAARDGRVSISKFYARRARRILPAATVTMIAVLTYAAVALPEARTDSTASDAGWAAVFLANVHFAHEAVDYFNSPAPSPFQHYWSLSVEEQFYLVWPLLILAITLFLAPSRRLLARGAAEPARHDAPTRPDSLPSCADSAPLRLEVAPSRRDVITGVAALVVVLSLGWSLYATAHSATSAYFSTPARAYELGAGALLACLAGRLPAMHRYVRAGLGIVGLGALVAATALFSEDSAFPGWHALVPVGATVALLAAGQATPTGRVLSLPPLRYVGDISYSLYLWHWPILVLAPSVIPGGGTPQLLVELAVIGIAAALSYHLIETPFQKRRVPVISRGRAALALWPAALAIALVAGTSAQTYAGHLTAERKASARAWFKAHVSHAMRGKNVPNQLRTALHLADDGAPLPPDVTYDNDDNWERRDHYCYATWGMTDRQACAYGDTRAKRTVAVIGDSHAGMWLPALTTLAKREHVRVVPYVKLACGAYEVEQSARRMPQDECDDFRRWTLEQVKRLHPDTVLLAARGMLQVKDRDGVSKEQQWRDGVRETVDTYQRITHDVRVIADVPRQQDDPEDCVSDVRNKLEDCVGDESGAEVESNPITRRALHGTHAQYVDTTPLVCADRCPLVVGRRIVYVDASHLTASWVDHITNAFGRRLGNLAPA